MEKEGLLFSTPSTSNGDDLTTKRAEKTAQEDDGDYGSIIEFACREIVSESFLRMCRSALRRFVGAFVFLYLFKQKIFSRNVDNMSRPSERVTGDGLVVVKLFCVA